MAGAGTTLRPQSACNPSAWTRAGHPLGSALRVWLNKHAGTHAPNTPIKGSPHPRPLHWRTSSAVLHTASRWSSPPPGVQPGLGHLTSGPREQSGRCMTPGGLGKAACRQGCPGKPRGKPGEQPGAAASAVYTGGSCFELARTQWNIFLAPAPLVSQASESLAAAEHCLFRCDKGAARERRTRLRVRPGPCTRGALQEGMQACTLGTTGKPCVLKRGPPCAPQWWRSMTGSPTSSTGEETPSLDGLWDEG